MGLAGANIKKCTLTDAKISDVDFGGCDLQGMDFRSAFLKGCNFKGVKLMKANFDGASLEKAKLLNANCCGATFRKANCYEAKFIKTKLTNCLFTDCNLLWCNFKNAKGDVALDSFSGADVGYAEFTKSCITEAHLKGARNVDKAKNIPKAKKVIANDESNGPPKKVRRQKSFGMIDPEMKMKKQISPRDYGKVDENQENV